MSARPKDERAKSPDEEDRQPPFPQAEEETAQIAIDLFGMKLRTPAPPLADHQELPKDQAPVAREWRLVWQDCIAHLQGSLVGLFSFFEAVPRNAVKIINSVAGAVGAATEFARRVARAGTIRKTSELPTPSLQYSCQINSKVNRSRNLQLVALMN